MAITSIYQNDRSVLLSSAFREVLAVEMSLFERFAAIAVLSWVMKSASHRGSVVEVTEVA